MAAGDWTGDGSAEVALADQLGVAILGRDPTYVHFPEAAMGSVQVLLEDVDGDGRVDLVTQYQVSDSVRRLTVWKNEGATAVPVWNTELAGRGYVLVAADVNNSGSKELLSASDAVLIFSRAPERGSWVLAAELPNVGRYPFSDFALVDVVRVADVTGDGRNEIVATGNSGRVTVYKHFPRLGASRYPVIWQSPMLVGEELRPARPGDPVYSFTQGLAVADVTCDGRKEILAATTETGIHPERGMGNGRILAFRYDGSGVFEEFWNSGWTGPSSIPGLLPFDIDGDGCMEFIYNGQDVYGRPGDSSPIELIYRFPMRSQRLIVGDADELLAPRTALRIIPVAWTLPQVIDTGREHEFSMTFAAPWASATNVTVRAESDHPGTTWLDEAVDVRVIPGGEMTRLAPFRVRVDGSDLAPQWTDDAGGYAAVPFWIEITADSDYRQRIPLALTVRLPD